MLARRARGILDHMARVSEGAGGVEQVVEPQVEGLAWVLVSIAHGQFSKEQHGVNERTMPANAHRPEAAEIWFKLG